MKEKVNNNKEKNRESDLVNETEVEELSAKDEVKQMTEDEQKTTHETNNESPTEEEDTNEDKMSIEEKLLDEVHQLKDEKLRLLAEMENLRKRSDRERLDSIRFGSFNLARDILSLDDNLTRALEVVAEKEEKNETILNLIDGLKMAQKEFANILKKHGVNKINALNEKFDHNFHQAMVELENDKAEEGIVIQEMQSGYTMHDRLLRPSMVGVSKKPIKKDDDNKKD
jgi:molecular chaperone GrpE